ncbi:SWIM zinc finger family protein [Paenibacillus donghaensis]|uniref:SWIM zinc finger family protein n=1 Tax=Paenibacillus donghaensis TaxID=414771 RepID=UPI001883E484|nr:SWIM zinc finger family protein [Paenibacillus donghaensis]MBE9915267.1 SWIM zinc finger family protein [Paenibacillus donghaensis]
MNSNETIDDITWQKLIQSVGEQFSDLTIKRGFQCYKQGVVRLTDIADTGHVTARVEEDDQYKVELDTHRLSASRCSCPDSGFCKHMIAALLDYASQMGRSMHAIVNAHATAALKHPLPLQSSHSTGVDASGKGEAISALQAKASRIPDMSLAEWHGLFKLCITPLDFGSTNVQYARKAIEAIYALKPELPPALEQLFDLHAHLFLLIKLTKPVQHPVPAHTYLGYHTQVAADELQEAMGYIFDQDIAIRSEPELWPRMLKTLAYLRRQMLTGPNSCSYLFVVYDQFWRKWLYPNLEDTTLCSEELHKLQSAEEELEETLSRLPWMLAQSRIHFLMGEDRQAWTWLQEAGKKFIIPHGFLLSFPKGLAAAEDWPRFAEWLVQIGPMLGSRKRGDLHEYMEYWEQAVRHLPESEDRMWETLAGMLPYSKEVYEDSLLTYGRWRQWMDIQLSTGKEPLEFRVSVLQPIEKHAPELLLPFYHQAVERYILLKNRQAYKAAVKLLKRLSKLYKKLKREERWEQFIALFANRHSRLRALQEELQKGKLIS